MIESQYQEILVSNLHVTVGLIVGYLFYKLFKTRCPSAGVVEYARNWIAWGVMFTLPVALPMFTTDPSGPGFATVLLVFPLVIVFAGVPGLIYGILSKIGFISYIKNTMRGSFLSEERERYELSTTSITVKVLGRFITPSFWMAIVILSIVFAHNSLDLTKSFLNKSVEKTQVTEAG